MSILILTEPDDIHAVLIKLALKCKGYNCDLFFSADMPTKQKNNIYFNRDETSWHTIDNDQKEICWNTKDIKSIWWRRARKPYIPAKVHQEDEKFIRQENIIYHNSIPYLLNQKAWWVNPIASTYKTQSKLIQLQIAQDCGFKQPKTLISNSPDDIKKFISVNNSVIYKPFLPHYWAENEGMRLLYTDRVTLNDLPEDEMLQIVPGIYQQYVDKKFELRVTCFGSFISAVKIDSQNHNQGQTDWRKIPGQELVLSKFDLPSIIYQKIINFMQKIGIVFGCFDFIVTPDNEIYFLEVNEQGQFLWVEDLLPELTYMDMFAEFILNKNFNFSYQRTHSSLSIKDFEAKAQEIVKENIQKHIYLNRVKKAA